MQSHNPVIWDYLPFVADLEETRAERFSRLTDQAGLHASEVARIMGLTESAIYKIRRGDIKTYSMVGLLRLARRLNVSPYYLACEPEPVEAEAARLSQVEANIEHLGLRDRLRGPLPGEEPLPERLANSKQSREQSDDISLMSARIAQQNVCVARVLRAAFDVLDLHDPNVEGALRALEALS